MDTWRWQQAVYPNSGWVWLREAWWCPVGAPQDLVCLVQDCALIQTAEPKLGQLLTKCIFVWQQQPSHQELGKEGREQCGSFYLTWMAGVVREPCRHGRRWGEGALALRVECRAQLVLLCPWYIDSGGCAAPASCFLLDIIATCFPTVLAGRTGPRMSEDGQMYFINAPFFA